MLTMLLAVLLLMGGIFRLVLVGVVTELPGRSWNLAAARSTSRLACYYSSSGLGPAYGFSA
ncbi:hypothetical protein [Alkalilimnicola ehrlichii]|uniref:hypothetical protein n=1 Tax=Alkalilimnicola ehrlichii TaxID=351052 RepID=UPI001C6E011F|nr:hypothetical protein [Alkalilimnicola ehrlichii]